MERKIKRYFGGTATPDESRQVVEWLGSNAGSEESDRYLYDIYKTINTSPDEKLSAKAFDRFRSRLNGQKKRRPSLRRWLYIPAAAAVLIAAVIVTANFSGREVQPVAWHEVFAPYGERTEVTLPDGSVFSLNSGTKLIYPENFGKRSRQVYVAGEVFADITPDRSRPFIVSAAEVKVRVLGTRFNLKSFVEDETAEIMLVEGAVEFETTHNEVTSVTRLAPGEGVRFDKLTGMQEPLEFPTEYYTNRSQGNVLVFSNEKLSQVAVELERRFGVRIIVEDEKLASTRYYAAFVNDEGLDEILATINSHGRMQITTHGGTYRITSR